ncbi:hypothetical protein [uncultured Clostridium sp.]|uniref:hypothetical protein n=1 Tax=uncultured Clostridium sp. TaxID=59620 RepID=UPI0025E2FC45|nr:hypothetical protein [uncultured Clostridium sp.]
MKFINVITRGIQNLLDEKSIKDTDLANILNQFVRNDWGVLNNEDKDFQNELLKNPKSIYDERFMGVYLINEFKIWIFREYDYLKDSLIITILFPEEY